MLWLLFSIQSSDYDATIIIGKAIRAYLNPFMAISVKFIIKLLLVESNLIGRKQSDW